MIYVVCVAHQGAILQGAWFPYEKPSAAWHGPGTHLRIPCCRVGSHHNMSKHAEPPEGMMIVCYCILLVCFTTFDYSLVAHVRRSPPFGGTTLPVLQIVLTLT